MLVEGAFYMEIYFTRATSHSQTDPTAEHRTRGKRLSRVGGFPTPVKLGEMPLTLAGNTDEAHGRTDNIGSGIRSPQRAGIDQKPMEGFLVIV